MGASAPARLGAGRALGIALRTAHLAAMALLLGAVCFDAPAAAARTWLLATALSGLALLVTELGHGRHWLVQVRGLMVLLHLGLLGLLHLGVGTPALVAALVVGAVGSHLPKALRKWSLWHGEVVE